MIVAIIICIISVFAIASCSKSCNCTEYDYYDRYSASRDIDPASYGARNCSDLELKLQETYTGYYYRCH